MRPFAVQLKSRHYFSEHLIAAHKKQKPRWKRGFCFEQQVLQTVLRKLTL
ncbi:MAG: hypothetical protein M1473_12930 [Firmicutes bacterium]|nr:hypothetical protein [Bacillota bacterium]